jgi:transposase-like protein
MKFRMAKATNERRVSQRCPFCKATAIYRETTVKGIATTEEWRCAPCGKTWAERRKAA